MNKIQFNKVRYGFKYRFFKMCSTNIERPMPARDKDVAM